MSKMITVRRVGVFSFAKIQALVGAVMGLFIGLIYGVILMIFGAAMLSGGGRDSGAAAAGGIVGGVVAIILFPLIYGGIGLVFGAIGALVYNAAAGVIGGLELEIEDQAAAYATTPPPPPDHWETSGRYQPPTSPS